MKTLVYPGSFDPLTKGHMDIITRAARLCDRLVVAVLVNDAKTPMFTTEQRVELIRAAVKKLDNVDVMAFDGLQVDFVKQQGAIAVVRGLRDGADLPYEQNMATINKALYSDYEVLYLGASEEVSFISSSLVRELITYKGDYARFVPESIVKKLDKYIKENAQ